MGNSPIGFNDPVMKNYKTKSMSRINTVCLPVILILLLSAPFAGCTNNSGTAQSGPVSTVSTDIQPISNAIDWSTVTPEDLWAGVSAIYEDDGAQMALILLERGMERGVVGKIEANQRRAGYMYEMGRMDEAFLALTIYHLDESRTDLLQLRAEVLWSMGRYDEARRDYEVILGTFGDVPDFLVCYQLARLYEELGEWDRADEIAQILLDDPSDPVTRQYNLVQALKSENIDEIRDAGIAVVEGGFEMNPMATFAAAYGAFLEGSYDSSLEIIADYIELYGADLNIISLALRIDTERDDFETFENDLRDAFANEDAVDWLDQPVDGVPHYPQYRTYISGLLDFAIALELGKGDPLRAELLAGRALDLNPYDHIGLLQQAAISMLINDLPAAFEKLTAAYDVASPTDVRTRLRMLQFANLSGEDLEVPWEAEEIISELETMLDVLRKKYPENSYYMSAEAEVEGFNGNFTRAIEIYEGARELPGATREMYFRQAYWMALNGDPDGAFELFASRIPSRSPDLMWAKMLKVESGVTGDESLTEFAGLVIIHLDPDREHAQIFY